MKKLDKDNNLEQNRDMYLNLLKQCLTFSLWPEPSVPASVHLRDYSKDNFKRKFNLFLENMFLKLNRQLLKPLKYSDDDRLEGKTWSGYAHSMVGRKRLQNIQDCIHTIVEEQIPGDVLEAGVWRGGAAIFMKACLKAYNESDRKVWLADSFEGLPEPNPVKYPADSGDFHHTYSFLSVSREEVVQNFRNYKLFDDNVKFLEGWFKDTLPNAPIDKLSILRADGDMYESTHDILTNLYHKLSPGGFCIIDDYCLDGCRKAVQDFRQDKGIHDKIIEIDSMSVYWRKKSVK